MTGEGGLKSHSMDKTGHSFQNPKK